METKQFIQEKPKNFNWPLTLKVVTIGAVIIVLMIPKLMILELIKERESTAGLAKTEVEQKWSLGQTVRGPVLTIPYIERISGGNKKEIAEEIHECHFLPKTLQVNSGISPKELNRSIYKTVVYESEIKISGSFDSPDFESLKIKPADILWEKATLTVAISDLRGICSPAILRWGSQSIPFSPGMENRLLGDNGISVLLPQLSTQNFPNNFSFDLRLKGSETLQFAPLGETTDVTMASSWKDPGFQGNFLPEKRNIDEKGFTAQWKILNFNRNFPQFWKGSGYNLKDSDFGVELVTLAGHYQKTSRTAKYGIMVILFIFLSFFLNEMITKQKIHPFQYILVGFAILIFYLLLLSVSEHLGYNLAYLISALSVTVMVFAYSRSFLKSWGNSLLLTAIIAFSFGFIFVLMQMESYALLVGSIGLFAVLALTMFFTRKINWYSE